MVDKCSYELNITYCSLLIGFELVLWFDSFLQVEQLKKMGGSPV